MSIALRAPVFDLLHKTGGTRLENKRRYISDVVDTNVFESDKLNLITSPCGSGKSKFISQSLLHKMPYIHPWEVILVTSRAITADQQAGEPGMSKFNPRNQAVIDYWNGDSDDVSVVRDLGIQVMTYDKLAWLISEKNSITGTTLQRLKIIVLDECHAMFSDKFIGGMGEIIQWTRKTLESSSKFIIGLTATPEIVYSSGVASGFKVNLVLKEDLESYVADQLICTNFSSIPYLITSGTLSGKTMIMCHSVKKCYELQREIPGSAVMISPHNEGFTKEMEFIRTHIAEHATLPEYYYEDVAWDEMGVATKKIKRKLNVLIATSTLREGLNIEKKSGVRNIVSCLTDSLHVTQFVGRARYNLDKIVVADTIIPTAGECKNQFMVDERKAFKDFLYYKSSFNWFASIGHLVGHTVNQVWRIVLGANDVRFIQYINGKWLIPNGADETERDKRKIWREEDKDEIRKQFCDCKITNKPLAYVTFNHVIKTLEQSLGYEVESKRHRVNEKQYTYKLIVAFDEEVAKRNNLNRPIDETSLSVAI